MKVKRNISDKDGIPESDKKFIKESAKISICGSDCPKCYCFESKNCNGCNEHKGVVFHCNKKECSIYNCCVTKKMVLKIVQNAEKFPVKFGKKLGIQNFLMKNLLKTLKKELRC